MKKYSRLLGRFFDISKRMLRKDVPIFEILIIAIFQLIGLSCTGQKSEFEYKPIPENYLPSSDDLIKYKEESDSMQTNAYDVTQDLPTGFVTDGTVDYTSILQQAINNYPIVVFPNFPVLINKSGLILRSNTTIIFQQNSELKMAANAEVFYTMLSIREVNNINLYFPKLKGDRQDHLGKTGEWGFGIFISHSQNIKIVNPEISDCWGDGIDITGGSDQISCYYPVLDNNRRNGLTISNVTNLLFQSGVIANTNGTSPFCGIDIEPGDGKGELKNVTISDLVTFNNKSFGIIISLTAFVSDTQKNINITIRNCTDDGSNYGMGFAFGRSKDADLIYASGSINVINPTWKNNRSGELWLPFYASKNSIQLKVQNPKVFKKGETRMSALKPVILSNSKNIIVTEDHSDTF